MAAVTTTPQVFTSGCFMLLKTGTLLTWHCQGHREKAGTCDGMSPSTQGATQDPTRDIPRFVVIS